MEKNVDKNLKEAFVEKSFELKKVDKNKTIQNKSEEVVSLENKRMENKSEKVLMEGEVLMEEVVTVESLADILVKKDLNELEYEDSYRRIYFSRKMNNFNESITEQNIENDSIPLKGREVKNKKKEEIITGEIIRSPMVGTAYTSSQPGSSPFIRVGEMVNSGQTLLIIEAMKVLNTIKSPKNGVVKEIYFYDQKPIEYDEALLIIE